VPRRVADDDNVTCCVNGLGRGSVQTRDGEGERQAGEDWRTVVFFVVSINERWLSIGRMTDIPMGISGIAKLKTLGGQLALSWPNAALRGVNRKGKLVFKPGQRFSFYSSAASDLFRCDARCVARVCCGRCLLSPSLSLFSLSLCFATPCIFGA